MVKQELIITPAREREREREHNVVQESQMTPVCNADGISALMAHLFQVTSRGDASVTTTTRVKGHLLLQIKISVVQVGRDNSDNGEGCIVHH